jgi:predicted GTPase/uncharacterized protein YqgC (DUF456 family)
MNDSSPNVNLERAAGFGPGLSSMVAARREIFHEHFDFIQKLIANYVPSGSPRCSLDQRLSAIRVRLDDPRLYIGVLGEFCAGKSTFINGLLRQDLLKASIKATTASITQIRNGAAFTLTATFASGNVITASESTYESLRKEVCHLEPEMSTDASLRDLLHALTSNHRVAGQVKALELVLPAPNLGDSLVIFDTPGINAGQDYAANDAQVTIDALDRADGAIVLIYSEAPMPATLLHFLETKLRTFLNRCIFVITAADRIEKEDLPEIIGTVRRMLKERVGLSEPPIFCSAAPAMIPGKAEIIPSLAGTASQWRADFERMEQAVMNLLEKQRQQMISETLVRLLSDLVQDLNEDVNSKRREIETKQQELVRTSVEAIEQVVGRLYNECAAAVNQQRSVLKDTASKSHQSARVQAVTGSSNLVTKAGWDVISYDTRIQPAVRAVVDQQSKTAIEAVNRSLQMLRSTADAMAQRFRQQFEDNYRRFPSLKISVSVPAISVSSISIPTLNFASSHDYTVAQDEAATKWGKWGAIVGGVVGSALLPGFGTIIGAMIGGGGGLAASGDSLEDRQRKLIKFAEEDIGAYFLLLENSVCKSIDAVADDVLDQFKHAGAAHIHQYKDAVGRLIAEQQARTRTLNQELQQTQADTTELEHKCQNLARLQTRFQTAIA